MINLENFELANKRALQVINDLDLKVYKIEYCPPSSLNLLSGEVSILVDILPQKFMAKLKDKGYTKFQLDMNNNYNIYHFDLSNCPALTGERTILPPSVIIRFIDLDGKGIQ